MTAEKVTRPSELGGNAGRVDEQTGELARVQRTPTIEPVLLRASECARLLAMSRSQIYALMAGGSLPTVRIRGSVRVDRRRLDNWLNDQAGAQQ